MKHTLNDALILAAVASGAADAPSIRSWVDWIDHSLLSDRQIAAGLRHLAAAGLVTVRRSRAALVEVSLHDLVRVRRPGLVVELAIVLLKR